LTLILCEVQGGIGSLKNHATENWKRFVRAPFGEIDLTCRTQKCV